MGDSSREGECHKLNSERQPIRDDIFHRSGMCSLWCYSPPDPTVIPSISRVMGLQTFCGMRCSEGMSQQEPHLHGMVLYLQAALAHPWQRPDYGRFPVRPKYCAYKHQAGLPSSASLTVEAGERGHGGPVALLPPMRSKPVPQGEISAVVHVAAPLKLYPIPTSPPPKRKDRKAKSHEGFAPRLASGHYLWLGKARGARLDQDQQDRKANDPRDKAGVQGGMPAKSP